jgi:2-amino-4-hydroxy-6-hydroxymethyldihydropteridine diphosphokinase
VQNPHGGAIHLANLAAQPEEAKSVARRVRAYVGLGANLGDAEGTLRKAVRALAALPGAHLAGVSRLYATLPVGVTDQPEFRNAVVALEVPAGPDPATGATALLVGLKNLERAFGRRLGDHWGPRELDLDLLVFGRATLSIERPPAGQSLDAAIDPGKAAKLLDVPHPLAHERLFVLAPLADLAPGLVPPGWGESVETARRRQLAIEGPAAVRAIGRWHASENDWAG